MFLCSMMLTGHPLHSLYNGPFRALEVGSENVVLEMGGHRGCVPLDRHKPMFLLG